MSMNFRYGCHLAGLVIALKWATPIAAQTLPLIDLSQSLIATETHCVVPNPDVLDRPAQPQAVQVQTVCPLTLEQAIAFALQHNPKLRAQALTLEKSKAALRQANAALYPTVTLQGGPNRQESFDLSNQSTTTTTATVSNTLSGEASVSYNLYTSGQRAANIRAAQKQVDYDALGVRALTEQTRLDITTNYYDLQNADAQVTIQNAAVANAQESLRIAEAREKFGIGTRFDVLQSRVQLANATQNLTNALSQQKIARRQLAQQLNLAQTINLTAADPVQAVGTWPLTLETSIVQAYAFRVELDQYLAQKEIGQQNRRAALAALGPTLALTGSANLSGGLDSSSNWSTGYSVGANVQWTAFDGGAARASAKQFEKTMEIAEANFADTRNQIRFEVEQAYENSRANLENIQTTTLAIEEAQEALRLARLRFEAGVGTQSDVIDAESNLTQAQGNRIEAIVNYNKAIATLIRNTGDLRVEPQSMP
ncbi:MAG: TolC family protein [Thermosynechococcaceae cyanobacterium]